MNLEKVFKRLVIIHFFALFFSGIWVAFEDSSVGDYHLSSVDVIWVIAELAYFVTLYFLFKFKPLGKQLYVPLIIFLTALTLGFPGEYVSYSVFLYVFDTVYLMTTGMIIAMLYWTEISKKFEG